MTQPVNVPTTLVVHDTKFTLKQKRANALVASNVLYIDSAGDSKPKRPHLHINPECGFSLPDVERLLLAIKT